MQFTLWYPVQAALGWLYPPELQIYGRANKVRGMPENAVGKACFVSASETN